MLNMLQHLGPEDVDKLLVYMFVLFTPERNIIIYKIVLTKIKTFLALVFKAWDVLWSKIIPANAT